MDTKDAVGSIPEEEANEERMTTDEEKIPSEKDKDSLACEEKEKDSLASEKKDSEKDPSEYKVGHFFINMIHSFYW